jgi:hypothetical protein
VPTAWRSRLGPSGRDLAGVTGIGADAAYRRRVPAGVPIRRDDPAPTQRLGQADAADALFYIRGEQLLHDRGLRRLDPHAGGVARALQSEAIALWRTRPRQEEPRAHLHLPTAAHPLGADTPLVLGHRPPDLQQQLVVRVRAHRPVEELDRAAPTSQFFQQQRLVDVVAGQAIGRGQQDAIDLARRDRIAQPLRAKRSGAVSRTRSISPAVTASRSRSSPGRYSEAPL